VWIKKPDEGVIIQWLGFMSDMRKWGNICPYLVPAQQGLPEHLKIRPVKGLNQARQKVKEAKQRREEIKRVKIAKIKAMREAKAALAMSAEGGAFIGPVNKGAGPTMVIPRKASPVLRVASPARTPSLQQSRTLTKTQFSESDSSISDRIVTPPTSIAESSSNPQTSPVIETTSAKLRKMGLNPDIPDEIAHQLAEMLTKLQAIGLERAQKEKGKDPSPELSVPKEKENGGRRRRRARHAAKQTHDLEVSVESESSGSEVSDGLSIGPVTEKASEVGSWMTGDLNMDEDTRAIMSGAGTDTGSAL
jgi:cation transport regulator ChaB